MKMGATTGEDRFIALEFHPVLIRLVSGEESVGNVRLPNLVSALRPLDWNLY